MAIPGHTYPPCLWEIKMINGESWFSMAGTIKFDHTVSRIDLIFLAQKIKNLYASELWHDLHVRCAGNSNAHYIGLHLDLEDGEASTQEQEIHKILQLIINERGLKSGKESVPVGVDGWSISTVVVYPLQH